MKFTDLFPTFEIFTRKLNEFSAEIVQETDQVFYNYIVKFFSTREFISANEQINLASVFSKWSTIKQKWVKLLKINSSEILSILTQKTSAENYTGALTEQDLEAKKFLSTGASSSFTPAIIDRVGSVIELPEIWDEIAGEISPLFFNVGEIPTDSENGAIGTDKVFLTNPRLENVGSGTNQRSANENCKIAIENNSANIENNSANIDEFKKSLPLTFSQENPTEQNLWNFIHEHNLGVGDKLIVNGRAYTIFIADQRPTGLFYLWSPQRHFAENKFETETNFLTCGNQGNLLNPRVFKNITHADNLLLSDNYGAQGAHNDLPLTRLLRWWDGTIDDLENPNLWQSIVGWPAENENDYSGVYNVFTKHTWKLDRNRVNRVIYNYDENTNSDEITYKLPVKTTKTDNFADTELIPQSEVKKLVNGGGGTQPWSGITWTTPNDFLELKIGAGDFPNTTFTDQGRYGIKNQRIRYSNEGSGIRNFTVNGTIYIKNHGEKHPDTTLLYFFTTPFYFNGSIDKPLFKVLINHQVISQSDPVGGFFYLKFGKINTTGTLQHTIHTINSTGYITNVAWLNRLVEVDIVVCFKIYTADDI